MKLFLIGSTVLVSVVHLALAQEPAAQGERTVEIQRLMAIVSNEKNYTNDFPKRAENGAVLIGQSENIDRVADSMIQLGRMKAGEAIPILIKHIDFTDVRYCSMLNKRPVPVRALIEIGEPSVQPLLDASKIEDNAIRLIRMSRVLVEIKGKEEALRLIESAASQSTNTQEKGRLEKLRSFVLEPPANVF